ncbi:MAG: YihY/virulence factor BrkB family protein [Bryobacterales bacterium]|nr:YihY/virulence factor BrkB family protein [Bryobacterales bacterium]
MLNLRARCRIAVSLIRETVEEWCAGGGSSLAAALAFHTALSLAPMLIIAVAVASSLLGQPEVHRQVLQRSMEWFGPRATALVQTILTSARANLGVATFFGIVTLLFTASIAFVELQDALNGIWEVAPRPGRFLHSFLRKRVFSFVMLMGIGLLILLSVLVSATLAAFAHMAGELLPLPALVLYALNGTVSMAMITVVFAAIYKVIPDVKSSWRDVWVGAAATALLFTIGKGLIGFYLGLGTVGNAYGAAGSLVVLLMWIYYSAQIFLLGAEFTRVYARRYGSRIVPGDNAVRMRRVVRVEG